MNQIYTILFDLDGTIVNTAPDLMAAHNHVMRKFGHSEKKLEDIKSLAGRGAWVMMQRSFKEEIKNEKTKKEMTKEFIDYYSKNIDKNSVPIKGSIDFFNWAKNKNIVSGEIKFTPFFNALFLNISCESLYELALFNLLFVFI